MQYLVSNIISGTPKDSKLGYFCSTNTDLLPVVCPYLPPARHSQTIAQLSKEVLDPDDELMAMGSGWRGNWVHTTPPNKFHLPLCTNA